MRLRTLGEARAAIRAVTAIVGMSLGACALPPGRQMTYQSLFPPPRGLDEFFGYPEDNPPTREKIALGARLFSDPLLSRDSTRACSSCHSPSRAFSDSIALSSGALGRTAARNTPTLVNRAYGGAFFWDGRTESLEVAVLMPIENPNELALPLAALVARLKSSSLYRARFARTFPRDSINATTIARALASYVRAQRLGNARVDVYTAGDTSALSPAERRGRDLFLGKARCSACHAGPTFTDEHFHNTGVSWGAGDVGRERVTTDPLDRGRFKTPTLREIARTAPYMHDGSKATLEEVVEFYDRGGNPNPNLDPDIKPRRLSPDEKRDLLAFLRALGGIAEEPMMNLR